MFERWRGSQQYSQLLLCSASCNCVVLPRGQGRGLGYSCPLPSASQPLRTFILPPHHAGTVPHQLFWLPRSVQHRLGLQKWTWLHLAGAPMATCPVWWEGSTSAGQSDQHLCPQPSPSTVGHCPEHQQGTQKEAENFRRRENKISCSFMSSFSFYHFRHFPRW